MENYFFEAEKEKSPDKVFVLIIYDIVDNKRRTKLAKYLQGFGRPLTCGISGEIRSFAPRHLRHLFPAV